MRTSYILLVKLTVLKCASLKYFLLLKVQLLCIDNLIMSKVFKNDSCTKMFNMLINWLTQKGSITDQGIDYIS